MQSHRVLHSEGPHAWGLMLCDYCPEILNSFSFEFMVDKRSVIRQWSYLDGVMDVGICTHPLRLGQGPPVSPHAS